MIDFPASPTDGQIFRAPNGVVYKWSATYSSWLAQNPTPSLGGVGEVTATSVAVTNLSGTDIVLPFATVVGGNAGLWWNTSTSRYTPPAGKYFLNANITYSTAAGGNSTLVLAMRKNGAVIGTPLSTSTPPQFYGAASVGQYVDANGTDFFDVVAHLTAGSTTTTCNGGQFTAFALSGTQGPTGPAGAPGSGPANADFWAAIPLASAPALPTVETVFTGAPVITGNVGGYYNPTTGRFTPPAGRYFMFAQIDTGASSGALQTFFYFRKNGVHILRSVETPSNNNYFNTNKLAAIVDANGTDYFDVTVQGNAASGLYQDFAFGATPTQGLIGPQGPPGPPGSGPPNADFCANQTSNFPAITGTLGVMVLNQILTGNLGGYYNTATGRYTPPAGRYLIDGSISCTSTSADFLQVQLMKNGAIVQRAQDTVSSAGATAQATVSVIVDANGTDYFEFWANHSAGTLTPYFILFRSTPTQGLIGPQGPQGPPGTGISWRQLASVTTIAQAFVDVTALPSDINHIQVMFDITPTFNDVDLMVQIYDGSGVLDVTPAHYGWVTSTGWNSAGSTVAPILTTQATASAAVNYGIVLDYGAASGRVGNQVGNSISGSFTIQNVRDTTKWKKTTSAVSYVVGNGTYMANCNGGGYRNVVGAMTGFRLSFIGGSSIAAGGNVTVWGSP